MERFNRFLKCCRINLLKLYGSSAWLCSTDTGGRFQSRRFVVPSSVPPRRGRADCLRPLRRRPSIPRAIIRLSSFSPLSTFIRYDRRGGGSEAAGRLAARSAGRRTRRAISPWLLCIMCSCRCLPCVPRIARRHAALRIDSARSFRFRMMLSLTHFRHACDTISPRLSDTMDGERNGAGACSTMRIG